MCLTRAADALGSESYKLHGSAPVYAILGEAHERADAASARNVKERAIEGAPVPALVKLVEEVNADLLVVGDVGHDTAAGRLLGSVPAEVARKARIDILIVHTPLAEPSLYRLTNSGQHRKYPASNDLSLSIGPFCRRRCCGHAPSASAARAPGRRVGRQTTAQKPPTRCENYSSQGSLMTDTYISTIGR